MCTSILKLSRFCNHYAIIDSVLAYAESIYLNKCSHSLLQLICILILQIGQLGMDRTALCLSFYGMFLKNVHTGTVCQCSKKSHEIVLKSRQIFVILNENSFRVVVVVVAKILRITQKKLYFLQYELLVST